MKRINDVFKFSGPLIIDAVRKEYGITEVKDIDIEIFIKCYILELGTRYFNSVKENKYRDTLRKRYHEHNDIFISKSLTITILEKEVRIKYLRNEEQFVSEHIYIKRRGFIFKELEYSYLGRVSKAVLNILKFIP